TLLAAFLVRLFSGYSLLAGSSLGTAEVHDLALRDFETFSAGFSLALVFFGVHLILFGTLLKRSKYVPTALSILLIVAGVGYVADSLAKFFVPSHGDLASMLLLTPALLSEVGLTGWLLVKGVRAVDEEVRPHVPQHSVRAAAG
ncbi:MAG: DUF4386 domain-containing protein, partial [Gemmatimonadota bacterium]|nr:DUF4386 domain-containing protein [Gemmatimonadota bacterium]